MRFSMLPGVGTLLFTVVIGGLSFTGASPSVAQPVEKGTAPPPPSPKLLKQERLIANKEIAQVRIPLPETAVPDEVKPICVAGWRALAVRYGTYGSILWDIDCFGVSCRCR
ncbi:MAG: hypothetical protein IPJ68_05835 [Candidatus Moraniibacteriota bacterium]|nr:MAG: hypothetical protein IPJ68_05835 [Candidatus Moranbacteria bacterium]